MNEMLMFNQKKRIGLVELKEKVKDINKMNNY